MKFIANSDPTERKKRLFISIPLSDEIISTIIVIQEKLKNSKLLIAKFVKPQNLHLTLSFIGAIDSKNIYNLVSVLKNIKQDVFTISFSKLEYKRTRDRKILWFTIISEQLSQLAQKIENNLINFKKQETRMFTGHITIARIKKIRDQKAFENLLQNIQIPALTLIVDHFDLVESELISEGPIYNKIMSFKLH